MSRRSKTGFTLIELLVVIAIIAILAAILFPVFAKARDKARQATCLSNVKQLALGVMMYKSDYDETFPPVWNEQDHLVLGGTTKADIWSQDAWIDWGWDYYSDPGYFLWGWQDLIYPYTKSMGVADCPNGGGAWGQTGTAAGVGVGNYGANVYIMGYPSPATHPGASNVVDTWKAAVAVGCSIKTDAAVQDPANKYLLMDYGSSDAYAGTVLSPYTCHYLPGAGQIPNILARGNGSDGYWGDSYYFVGRNGYGNPDDGVMTDFVKGRHSGGVCVAFADGHAKWETVKSVVQGALNWASNYSNQGVAGYVQKPDPWSPAFSQ